MTARSTSKTFRALPVSILVATTMIAGCASMGNGSGTEPSDGKPVAFTWDSKDGGNTGKMSATLDGGRSFNGSFRQFIRTVQTNDLAPQWYGSHAGWPQWNQGDDGNHWSESPEAEFSTHYSGEVLANLKGVGTQQLSCRFHLDKPTAGMRGGGQGECQSSDGRSISALFPRS